jgi:hypothetical protein
MYENRTIKSIRIVKKKRGGWDKKVMEWIWSKNITCMYRNVTTRHLCTINIC